MTRTFRGTAAAAIAATLVLTATACSKDVKGDGSPASKQSTSSSSSESSATSESKSSSSKPAGSIKAKDGSFSFNPPSGYEDAIDSVSVPGALAAVLDPSSGDFKTHIVINSESSVASLDSALDQVRKQVESKFSTTTKLASPKIDSVDGEEYRAWTTEDYTDAGQTIASAQVMTKHDGKLYYFTVNTSPTNKSAASDALLSLVNSVKWS